MNSDIDVFHSAPPLHKHGTCENCVKTRRCEGLGALKSCSRCLRVSYCSTDCQKAHWKHHKPACALYAQARRELEEKLKPSGQYPHAYADFVKWCEYYDTPLKNATIAALRLFQEPHAEKSGLLSVSLHYKEDWSNHPVHKRFTVEQVDFPRRWDTPALVHPNLLRMVRAVLDPASTAAAIAKGKIEFGNNFYGVAQYLVAGFFVLPGSAVPVGAAEYHKSFSFDNDTARADVTPHWVMLFRDFVLKGTKMRFCCRKMVVPGSSEPLCCCGGWTHNLEDVEAFHAA
ncbi:hypothetical protein FIBSPDRAFT_854383 [Athelia psychrophila]|uniref:MYND-type domain-containing protein n=1 Tax=Athelia psychrophila TaxID=1759441 RepID=A0A166Q3N2_9AGAM|nr:hypothetical protein FIBSPDRAFT_854383 [Fibularhizoctonia sp. CBS 109695]